MGMPAVFSGIGDSSKAQQATGHPQLTMEQYEPQLVHGAPLVILEGRMAQLIRKRVSGVGGAHARGVTSCILKAPGDKTAKSTARVPSTFSPGETFPICPQNGHFSGANDGRYFAPRVKPMNARVNSIVIVLLGKNNDRPSTGYSVDHVPKNDRKNKSAGGAKISRAQSFESEPDFVTVDDFDNYYAG